MSLSLIHRSLIGSLVAAVTAVTLSAFLTQTAIAAPVQDLYGALYFTGNLEAETGSNTESVLLYHPGTDGFIAITTNGEGGAEWWTSDALGQNWTRSASNPLAPFNCNQPGRHSAVQFDGAYYFGASCQNSAKVFKLTGLEAVEEIHSQASEGGGPGEAPSCSQFPTATVVDDKLIMFCNGGFVEYNGTTATFVDDALGQGEGVPLEASPAVDGSVYLAGTGNAVTSFNGTQYGQVGTVEGASLLPAVGILGEDVFVGDIDADNGATIYLLGDDGKTFSTLFELDAEDEVVNKMQTTDDGEYLVFYTGNPNGTNIYAISTNDDGEHELITLVGEGLGGENPENNKEVVSILTRTVTDGDDEKEMMLFATQNQVDETKIFALNVGENLAINLKKKFLPKKLKTKKQPKKRTQLKKGKPLQINIPKKEISEGDEVTLTVNGKEVKSTTVTNDNKKLKIKYKRISKFKKGKKFNVEIGVSPAYGSGSDQQVSSNEILGQAMKMRILKKKKSAGKDGS